MPEETQDRIPVNAWKDATKNARIGARQNSR